MPTHKMGFIFQTDSGSVSLPLGSNVVDTEINEAITATAGWVNHEVDVEFLHAKVSDYAISITGPAAATSAITLNWNSTGSPAPVMSPTIHLPILFGALLSGTTNLFSADITKVYISNPNAADVVVNIHIGLNDVV